MNNPTLTLPISSVTVYRPNHGPDEIHIVAPLPSPFMCDENSQARFVCQATRGTGVQWVRDNLHMEPEFFNPFA